MDDPTASSVSWNTRKMPVQSVAIGTEVYIHVTRFDKPRARDGNRYSDFFKPNAHRTFLSGHVEKQVGKKLTVIMDIDKTTCNFDIEKIKFQKDDNDLVLSGEGTYQQYAPGSPIGPDTNQLLSENAPKSIIITNSNFGTKQSTEADSTPAVENTEASNTTIVLDKIFAEDAIPQVDTLSETNVGKRDLSQLCHGEEVYLTKQGLDIFKATYQKVTDSSEQVHGIPISENESRFFITKVLKDARSWKEFDFDKMDMGSAILWDKNCVKRITQARPTSGTEMSTPIVLEKKKRKRNEEQWQSNIKKAKLASGEGYVIEGKRKGKEAIKKKVTLKPPCDGTCRKQCRLQFTDVDRQKMLDSYLKLPNITEKRCFLSKLVTVQPKSRTRKHKNSGVAVSSRNRSSSRIYSFIKSTDSGEQFIPVCQKMFLSTFDIDEKSVRTMLNKVTETGTVLGDFRGKHSNHATATEREEIVIQHIQLFQCVESHYVRKDSKWQYLPEELNVSQMYQWYTTWCAANGFVHENYRFYHNVFQTRFNLKFQKPKKDKCDACTEFTNTPADKRTSEYVDSHNHHLVCKDIVREIKKGVKVLSARDPLTSGCAFDLQKVMQCPHGNTSSFYYSRRLKNHNFTITDIETMTSECFIWNEEQANKGSCEIATCCQLFLVKKRAAGISKCHLFADRCGGQNCNRMVVIALHVSFVELDFEILTLHFLVTGHSQNENDSAHSTIEMKAKNVNVYTTEMWEGVITCAFQKNDVAVRPIQYTDIINFKSKDAFPAYNLVLSDKIKVASNDGTLEKIYWSRIMNIMFRKNQPDTMYFKYDVTQKEYLQVKLISTRPTRSSETTNPIASRRKYQTPPGICAAKKRDLLTLCEKRLVPEKYHSFYQNLVVNKAKADDAEFGKLEKDISKKNATKK